MAATGVPSRSPLLPLRTPSPGGVAHRPTSLTQSSTARSQQPTGNTDKGFPKPVQQSQNDLTVKFSERGSTHRLAQLHRITQTLPLNSAQASRSGNAHGFLQRHGLSPRPTQTPRSMDRVFMDSFGQHRLFLSISGLHAGLLQTGPHGSRSSSRVKWM
jgi:hypothetical protein